MNERAVSHVNEDFMPSWLQIFTLYVELADTVESLEGGVLAMFSVLAESLT